MVMKTILKQIKNEWNSNLFLFVELLLVFVVLWYIVDWTLVTARVYHAPMGFDTEHCYNITVSKLGEDSPLYNPELTADDDMDDLLRLTDRLRHCPLNSCSSESGISRTCSVPAGAWEAPNRSSKLFILTFDALPALLITKHLLRQRLIGTRHFPLRVMPIDADTFC